MSLPPDLSRGRSDNWVRLQVCGSKPRRKVPKGFNLPKRKYRGRGAPHAAMNRSEFARAVGKDRTTIWRWEQRGWLNPAGSSAKRPYYARGQIDECETIKWVRSAPVMRAIREFLARKRQNV